MNLAQEIQREADRFVKAVAEIPLSKRSLLVIEGTGGKVSVAQLIAYQIGWGKAVLRWFEAGKRGEVPEMPGDGFSKWDYAAIARSFYQKYIYDSGPDQMRIFHEVLAHLLEIVESEERADRLDQIGIWPWCTLPSGKAWPLSKWIRINTASPYRRAVQLMKKGCPAHVMLEGESKGTREGIKS